jgi:HEAT repeat protein
MDPKGPDQDTIHCVRDGLISQLDGAQSANEESRINAARRLGLLGTSFLGGDKLLRDGLIRHLDDRTNSGPLREACAWALGWSGNWLRPDQLVRSLRDQVGQDDQMHRTCCDAIARNQLVKTLCDHEYTTDEVRIACAEVLSGLDDQISLAALRECAADSSSSVAVRRACTDALARSK